MTSAVPERPGPSDQSGPSDLPGLPADRIDAWLRRTVPSLLADGGWSAQVISGGLSNITYRLHLAGGTVILRRPPLGGVLPSAHDMAREYRVISALAATDVPVPTAIAVERDPDVLGCPFYLMSDVAGDVLRTAADTQRLSIGARGVLSADFVENLARLHELDVEAVGLGDYGHGGDHARRQVRRWGEQWQRLRRRDLPDLDRLLAVLADRIPADRETTIVHGDYRVDNTVVDVGAAPGPAIVAVLDWELSTLGNPVGDLALAMTYWHDRGDDERASIPVAVGVTAHEGFPPAAELAEMYAQRTGRDLDQLPFYLGLAGMKLAVILEGVVTRHRGGHTVGGGYEELGDAVPALVARALRALEPGPVRVVTEHHHEPGPVTGRRGGPGGERARNEAGSGGGVSRWTGTPARAARYADRFAALAAGGADVHGEATFCADLIGPGRRVLDAGCGTGRVAVRLAELGYDCVGMDSDRHMLAEARAASDAVRWVLGDLAAIAAQPRLQRELGARFDLVVAAGNVIPLVAPGTEADVVANLARVLRPRAPLVAGFGLDAAHLPLASAPFGLAEYDAWCRAAGLSLTDRFAGWDRSRYVGGGYAVSIHRRDV